MRPTERDLARAGKALKPVPPLHDRGAKLQLKVSDPRRECRLRDATFLRRPGKMPVSGQGRQKLYVVDIKYVLDCNCLVWYWLAIVFVSGLFLGWGGVEYVLLMCYYFTHRT